MEFASWLAGERFSDHPACTHPLLATVARGVNDNLTDAGRQRIVRLISEVVGVNGDDPLVDVTITVRAAAMAITEAPFDQQKALAVGLLRCEAELDAMHDPRTADLIPLIESALAFCPQATTWAQHFVARPWSGGNDFGRARSHIVRVAVASLSAARGSDDLSVRAARALHRRRPLDPRRADGRGARRVGTRDRQLISTGSITEARAEQALA